MIKFSLRSVLIFPYVALVVALAIAIGFLSYRTGNHAMVTLSDHLLKETVHRISQAIDRHVVGSVATLEAAFPNGMLAPEDIEADFEKIKTRFWIATSLHIDPNNYVYYGNRGGQAIGLYRYSYEVGELRIKYSADEHRKFYQLQGINGKPSFLLEEEKLFDPRVRPWFKVGEKSDRDIWTSVYIDFRTEELVATKARRVENVSGELEGVVATDMSLRSLNNFVSQLDISPNGIAFILEPDGKLIASSSSKNVVKDHDGQSIRVTADKSGNELLSQVYLQLQPHLGKELSSFLPETFFFTDSQGREIHVAFNKFMDGAGLEWINVVALPAEDFMGDIKLNALQTLGLGILATILVVCIGLAILHWVTKDLKILSHAVSRVGSGHIEESIDIRRKDEIGDLAKNFKAMQRRLQTDYLTGLPNRYACEQYLKTKIEASESGEIISSFVLFFIDLNDFKTINDRFGHDVGDQVLIEIALRLKTSVRHSDFAARFAGDEFVIIMNGIDSKHDVKPIQNNIVNTLSLRLKSISETSVSLGGSVGVALYPEDGNTAEELLVVSDKRMYAQKQKIKNGVTGQAT